MTIAPVDSWKSTLAALPKVADSSWALNFANWVANQVILIEPDKTKVLLAAPAPVGFIFVFNSAAFAAQLASLQPVSDPSQGMKGFADAWASTIKTIVYPVGITVLPGTSGVPKTPATTFSVISSVLIDPASIEAGKAKIAELANAKPVENPNDSEFPVKFREAFLQLKINIAGINSITPTPAPYQLMNISLT